MANKKVSIIIPVFNIGRYLVDCLDSILKNSDIDKTEIILVNDGSTDNSEEICKKYITKNKKLFKYIKIKNSGLSEARNVGLSLSSGEMVWFVDGDDMIAEDAIEQIIRHEGPDIIMIGYSLFVGEKLIDAKQDFTEDVICRYIINTPIVPIRIFKRAFLNELGFRFEKGRFYEDSGSMYSLVKYTKNIKYLDKRLYIYRKRPGSITTDGNIIQKAEDRFWAANKILNDVPDEYVNEKQYQAIKTIGLFYTFDIFDNKIKRKISRGRIKQAELYLSRNIPKYWDNEYLKRKTKIMRAYRTYLLCLHLRQYWLCKIMASIRKNIIND